ncbi:PGF-CTERM sorting domain-containing protein [Haladaptatus sp. R4]|uniref:PGF-CTERM sorting domain-containing protein n=1 Tax=Haladaptatus sp. R4 TaxID=1679489 RepID=UPI001680367D
MNGTQTDVELSVSDFQEGDRGKSERTTRTANDGGQPGFTALAGIVALLGAGLLARRNGQP